MAFPAGLEPAYPDRESGGLAASRWEQGHVRGGRASAWTSVEVGVTEGNRTPTSRSTAWRARPSTPRKPRVTEETTTSFPVLDTHHERPEAATSSKTASSDRVGWGPRRLRRRGGAARAAPRWEKKRGGCSQNTIHAERRRRIELPSQAWHACTLPLCYHRRDQANK